MTTQPHKKKPVIIKCTNCNKVVQVPYANCWDCSKPLCECRYPLCQYTTPNEEGYTTRCKKCQKKIWNEYNKKAEQIVEILNNHSNTEELIVRRWGLRRALKKVTSLLLMFRNDETL